MELERVALRNGPSPKYLQIKQFLIERIGAEDLQVGDLLPSENKLAEDFGVTTVTASRALNELVNDGILYRVRGKGTFVKALARAVPSVHLCMRGEPVQGTMMSHDPYFTGPLFAVLAGALSRQGLGLTVKYLPQADSGHLPLSDLSSGVVIVFALNEGENVRKETIDSTRVPIICLGAHPEDPLDCISFNNREGMAQAMKHLADLGHTRIAFFSAAGTNISNRERVQEYRAAVERHGLVRSDSLIFSGIYSKDSGRQCADALLSLEERPTAVVCSSDVIAAGALDAFQERGVRIPADLSVVGFGDYEIASYLTPPLTTVSLPVERMGERLAELVLFRIDHPHDMELKRVAVPTALVVRESTGVPPGIPAR